MSPRTGSTPPELLESPMSAVLGHPNVVDLTKVVRRPTIVRSLPIGTAAALWGIARLGLGWIFLWPFLDKLFGLHHETPSANAWIHGGSPTSGFLSHATGPFAGVFHSFAGQAWADWGFMLGLLFIGSALLL